MANLTDPARELFDLAHALASPSKERGELVLSNHFGVEGYSTAFFRIVSCILERADRIMGMIPLLPHDPDTLVNLRNDIVGLKSAFGADSLRHGWDQFGRERLVTHGKGLQYISTDVRKIVSYPTLSDVEAAELIELMTAYRDQLSDEDIPPFLRQAIIDGLEQAEFQLRHLRWTGGAALLSAFRDLNQAADFVERSFAGMVNPVFDPGLILAGLRGIGAKFAAHLASAKGYYDTAAWVLLGYNALAPAGGLPQLPHLPTA